MIHLRASGISNLKKHGPFHGYFASSGFGPPNTKEQLRRGVFLATVASVLILVGSILIWLVSTEVFGSKVPILGPLVMVLGILLLILSIRQFYIVWRLKHNANKSNKKHRAEEGELPYGSVMEMDNVDATEGEKSACFQDSQQNQSCDQQIQYYNCPDQKQCYGYLQLQHYGHAISKDILPSYTHTTSAITANSAITLQSEQPAPELQSFTTVETQVATTATNIVRSCCDLSSMTRSVSMEASNPRPAVCYNQGQLELLDKAAAASVGCSSPTIVATAPSHHSLMDLSESNPHKYFSHKSISLSFDRTDILETI